MDDPRINEIFGEALDRRGQDRSSYLSLRCGDEPVLRARVEALLAAAEMEDEFLGGANGAAESWMAEGGDAEKTGERVGDRIGPYRLVSHLGEGGFGAVFRAEQERPVRRQVALKVLKLGMDTRSVVARFEQERQTLALMDHPGIARVVDAGATTSGRPYFVMDLVEGDRITEYCDRLRLPVARRLEVFEQVCYAVQHAHTKGIIHRDLKPSNVLVSEHGGRPLARVIDFGIAKATAGAGGGLAEQTLLTQARQVIGTPEYMSPEQAEASPDIDTRTDVYSLGVMLYELLAGAHPIDRARLKTASFDEVRRIIREEEPRPPSTRVSLSSAEAAKIAERRAARPAELGSQLRGELDWIVLKAMDKDRARRYQSPEALGADLRRYLSGDPVSAAPPSRAYRARKFVRRHRGAVVATGLVAAALVAGIVGTSVGLFKARVAGAESLRQARAAPAVNALITSTMQKANRARQGGRADLTVREVMDAAARELLEAPGSQDPEIEMLLARTIGETYRELSLYEPAEQMFRIVAERARQLHGEWSAEHAAALNELGGVVKLRGALAEAGTLYGRAQEILRSVEEPGLLAELGVNMAALAAEVGRLDEAEHELRESIAYFESRGRTSGEAYFNALHNLANVSLSQGKPEQAGQILTRVLGMERAAYGENDPRMLETMHGLTAVKFALNDPGAESSVREELALARRLWGGDHETVANLLHSLGVVLGRRGDLAGAVEAYRESAEVSRRVLGPEHRSTLERTASLANALRQVGRLEEAEALYREMLTAMQRFDEAGPAGVWQQDTIYSTYQYGQLLTELARLEEAEGVVRGALAAADRALHEGDRYEWMRWALSSLLGEVRMRRAGAAPAGERPALLAEAAALVGPAAERLVALAPKMGQRMRAMMVGAALERAVAVYSAWNEAEPTAERGAAVEAWRRRAEEFGSGAGVPR